MSASFALTLDTTGPVVEWGTATGTSAGQLLELPYSADETVSYGEIIFPGGQSGILDVTSSVMSITIPADIDSGSADVVVVDEVGNQRYYSALLELQAFQEIAPVGIPSAMVFGTPTISAGLITISPAGIETGENVGAPLLVIGIAVVGIPSTEALGDPTLIPGVVTITTIAIASDEDFGVLAVIPSYRPLSLAGDPAAAARIEAAWKPWLDAQLGPIAETLEPGTLEQIARYLSLSGNAEAAAKVHAAWKAFLEASQDIAGPISEQRHDPAGPIPPDRDEP